MYLTSHADYTLRLLIHLAVQRNETATIQEIAAHYGISRNHLMKVANQAVQEGYVKAVRGRMGGLRLAMSPREINIGRVLRSVEDWTMVECFDKSGNSCRITRGCGLRGILKEALDAYFSVLDSYSLADVVQRKTLLVQLLGLRPA
ncbi:MAG TPA: Rrf2 family transcriptional regulator [Bryobacteraceae bacterium]|jgi:Rrf2 family nitric oxide-sensitive transcriptional repressor|nr:Rrf2 family transcriptional regulator [Bryobacteraceae bacterium]